MNESVNPDLQELRRKTMQLPATDYSYAGWDEPVGLIQIDDQIRVPRPSE